MPHTYGLFDWYERLNYALKFPYQYERNFSTEWFQLQFVSRGKYSGGVIYRLIWRGILGYNLRIYSGPDTGLYNLNFFKGPTALGGRPWGPIGKIFIFLFCLKEGKNENFWPGKMIFRLT